MGHPAGRYNCGVNILRVALALAAILAAIRIYYFFRARAMRRLAEKWGFQYVGPTAPLQWWFIPSRPLIPASLPGQLHRIGVSQVWNILEGKNKGVSVFIFDGILGAYKGRPYTYVACKTEGSPFPIPTSSEPVEQMHGWTVLHGVRFGLFSWPMTIRRLDRHIDYLLN
jgi:hypothetical protein